MRRPALLLLALAAVCLAAVAAALFTQYQWDMQPCPWCILQRVIFLAIAAVCLLALPFAPLRRAAAVPIALLALCGVAAATYQHFVAASSASCNLSLAERIVAAIGLDAWWPEVFVAYSNCQDAAVNLFGLPFEAWSGLLFAGIGAAAWRLWRPETGQAV